MASSLTSTPSAVSNSSTASMPTTPSRSAIRTASSCAAGRELLGQPGRGREHLGADAVALHGLHDRPDRDLPERRAGDLGGELADHRHPLLDQQGAVRLEEVGHLVGAVDDEHALAVVAAARGLEHDRPADARRRTR